MNLLIIGNTASIGYNLKKGLLRYYPKHFKNIHITFEEKGTLEGKTDKALLKPNEYDVVVYNYPFIKTYFKYKKYLHSKAILINYFHGTDLRGIDFKDVLMDLGYKLIHSWFKHMIFRKAHINLYSTYDLAWWVKSNNKQHFLQIIDTDKFKPLNCEKQGVLFLKGGAKEFNKLKINHNDMPLYLNQYEEVVITPAEGLDPHTLQVTHLEALACGAKVRFQEDKNCEWVFKNASLKAGADRFIKILNKIKQEMINNEKTNKPSME